MDDKSILRLSLDAKARVNIGGFDRGGRNRIPTKTKDHDFDPKTTLTPYGIFLPNLDELFLYFTESKVTSDFIVDILADFWKYDYAPEICYRVRSFSWTLEGGRGGCRRQPPLPPS